MKVKSPKAERLVQELIVRRGLSYADAIRFCDREAEAVAAPYREVANELRAYLETRPNKEARAA